MCALSSLAELAPPCFETMIWEFENIGISKLLENFSVVTVYIAFDYRELRWHLEVQNFRGCCLLKCSMKITETSINSRVYLLRHKREWVHYILLFTRYIVSGECWEKILVRCRRVFMVAVKYWWLVLRMLKKTTVSEVQLHLVLSKMIDSRTSMNGLILGILLNLWISALGLGRNGLCRGATQSDFLWREKVRKSKDILGRGSVWPPRRRLFGTKIVFLLRLRTINKVEDYLYHNRN